MFYGCESLTSLGDLSAWDVSKVTNMINMFRDCSKIVSLDLSAWNVSKDVYHDYFNAGASGITLPLAWRASADPGLDESQIAPASSDQDDVAKAAGASDTAGAESSEGAATNTGEAGEDAASEGSSGSTSGAKPAGSSMAAAA